MGDVKGVGGADKRPQNFLDVLTVLPDPRVQIEFRRKGGKRGPGSVQNGAAAAA